MLFEDANAVNDLIASSVECPNVNSITLFSSVIELTLRNVNNSRNFHNTCLTLRSGNNIQLTLSPCNNTYLRSASLTNTCCSLATNRAPDGSKRHNSYKTESVRVEHMSVVPFTFQCHRAVTIL